jgi:hypothetical protein
MPSAHDVGERRGELALPEVRFRLTSPDFDDLGQLPEQSASVSPRLRWTAPPRGARTLAVRGELWERAPTGDDVLALALPGRTVWLGWGIAAAPGGLDEGQEPCFPGLRYEGFSADGDEDALLFSVLALDTVPPLLPGASPRAFDAAVAGHVLGLATLVGRRPRSRRWRRRLAGL